MTNPSSSPPSLRTNDTVKALLLSLMMASSVIACGSDDSTGGDGDTLSEDQQSCSFNGVCKRCKTMDDLAACSKDFENNPCEAAEASFCAK